jgi:hypothetical protein
LSTRDTLETRPPEQFMIVVVTTEQESLVAMNREKVR